MKRLKPYLIGGVVTAVLIFVAFSTHNAMAATGCFTDTNGHWAEQFICFAAEYGIVGGYPDGTYQPENRVTRAEAAVMFQNTLKVIRGEGRYEGVNKGLILFNGTAVLTGTVDQFNEVSITVPSDGALIINGYVNLNCLPRIGLAVCGSSLGEVYARVDGGYVGRQKYRLDGGAQDAGTVANINISTYATVAAGTHDIDFEIDNSGPNSTYHRSGGINVLFVPFDGSGVIAVTSGE